MKINRYTTITGLFSLLLFPVGSASSGVISEIQNIEVGEIQAVGVELSAGGEYKVESVGIGGSRNSRDNDMLAYGWIIDHESREMVWYMRGRDTERSGRDRELRSQENKITLDAGKYEIYFYAADLSKGFSMNFKFNFYDDDDDDFGSFFGNNRMSRRDYSRFLDDCYIRLSSEQSSGVSTFTVNGDLPGALLRKNRLEDSEFVKWGFKLDSEQNLRIYSVFEFTRGSRQPVDYGWIVNADNRERVWEIDRWETERAGGARKNRKIDSEVKLPAGNYILHFVTDDSHSFERFNQQPPFDPFNWGITVLPGEGFQKSAFHEFEPPVRAEALIDFSRARDDDSFEQAFRLSKPTTLHVFAIGEASSREFVDYGWIENATSHKTVWEMTTRNTEYAGGGRKNKMFDGTIDLPAGDYIAYYLTDGSHSYRDWNASPPFEPAAWGMAISAAKGEDASGFQKISSSEITTDSDVLVSLTKIRDNQRRRAKFTLDERSRVRIYAIGEGTGRDMADFAWIIDDKTGRDVWEMRYRETRHAGGAKKNRLIDEVVELEPGTYVVYYVSDGSHSFNDWNSTKPRDFRNWGVTISLADRR